MIQIKVNCLVDFGILNTARLTLYLTLSTCFAHSMLLPCPYKWSQCACLAHKGVSKQLWRTDSRITITLAICECGKKHIGNQKVGQQIRNAMSATQVWRMAASIENSELIELKSLLYGHCNLHTWQICVLLM